ncbi:MAG TPA: hypothetical protein VNG12_17045 [Acidimicrobiales bacterium]|nr:hypothetical protein [Acidimicrobiales bacterium]
MNPGSGPHLSVAECAELAGLSAHIELTAATCMGSDGPSASEVMDAIATIGPEMVLLSTDYGWNRELPRPRGRACTRTSTRFGTPAPPMRSSGAWCAITQRACCGSSTKEEGVGPIGQDPPQAAGWARSEWNQ